MWCGQLRSSADRWCRVGYGLVYPDSVWSSLSCWVCFGEHRQAVAQCGFLGLVQVRQCSVRLCWLRFGGVRAERPVWFGVQDSGEARRAKVVSGALLYGWSRPGCARNGKVMYGWVSSGYGVRGLIVLSPFPAIPSFLGKGELFPFFFAQMRKHNFQRKVNLSFVRTATQITGVQLLIDAGCS